GRSIPELFEQDGEPAFRELEAATLRGLSNERDIVIATGGGAPTTPASRDAIAKGFSVWLDVSREVAVQRLEAQPGTEERPLLRGHAAAKLATLYHERAPLYARADVRIPVDGLSVEEAAAKVV